MGHHGLAFGTDYSPAGVHHPVPGMAVPGQFLNSSWKQTALGVAFWWLLKSYCCEHNYRLDLLHDEVPPCSIITSSHFSFQFNSCPSYPPETAQSQRPCHRHSNHQCVNLAAARMEILGASHQLVRGNLFCWVPSHTLDGRNPAQPEKT